MFRERDREVPRGSRGITRAVFLIVMWLLAATYVVALALHSGGWGPEWGGWFGVFVDDGLGLLTVWAPTAVCWLAAVRAGRRRPELHLAAAAVTSFAAGDTYYVLMTIGGRPLPFPSPADVGYLLVYPLLLTALAIAARRHARDLAPWAWLDCAVGSLGAGALLAVVLRPVLDSATADFSPLATAVAVAAPAFDLVLVAAIAGIAALRGVDMGSRWTVLASGLLVFAASDVVYGLQVAAETYVLGTPVDAGWAIGLALMATWVDGATHGERTVSRRQGRATALAVSSAATVAGLAVLLLSTWVSTSTLALGLAAAALLVAAARAQLAARLLEGMAEQRLVAAVTDELTGLPNRRAFYTEGHRRLTEPAPGRLALLMLDLDRFKEVNDSLGHRAGDKLLVELGARLRKNLRGGDLLARLGGDEFAMLLDGAGGDEALDAAARLSAAVAEPFVVEHTTLIPRVSIGIALFPEDGGDLSALMRKADIAMYRAKTSHRTHHVYSTADDVDAAAALQTVQELRTAIASDQFVIHYQPKVDLPSGEVHSVEALVRWDHPTRGLLHPPAFLDLVEESGLMPAMTRAVLSQALDQVADWHRDGRLLAVAVNLSPSSLSDPDLPCQVTAMLADRGLPARALQLEITEEFLMGDRDLAQAVLARLRDSGIRISVDDFGTGYNSLASIRDLPIDELKLDSSFVVPMTHDPRTAAVVSSTIKLAHSLGLRIVAEGVESVGTYTELTRLGCDQAQGHFMSEPVSAVDLNQWLEGREGMEQFSPIQQHIASPALT
jgi:diguanylate cyclase (GGDEF)-like protein